MRDVTVPLPVWPRLRVMFVMFGQGASTKMWRAEAAAIVYRGPFRFVWRAVLPVREARLAPVAQRVVPISQVKGVSAATLLVG